MTICQRIAQLYVALLVLVPMGLSAGVAHAQSGETHIKAELIAESQSVQPGETVMLAFRMRPEKGWHGYWENPGDAGVGMQLEWTLTSLATAGKLQYPVPQQLVIADLMNYVFEGDYAVLVPLTIAKDAAPGAKIPVHVRADWLSCTDEICVPESGTFGAALTVASPGSPAAEKNSDFTKFRTALPAPLGSEATWQIANGTLKLAIPYPASAEISEPYLFPYTRNVVDYVAPQRFTRDGNMLYVEVAANGSAEGAIKGLLRIGPDRGLDVIARPGMVSVSGQPIANNGGVPSPGDGMSTGMLALIAFGGAVLGGLILNIMPCVFPILSLKAIALAKSGGNENAVRREALAYSAGVVVTCVALGGVLLALRAGGEQIGWAFQLQEPAVVLFLMLLSLAIALNLAGLFELPGIGMDGGKRGAFGTGVLAAFVATPCTGPFMAAALGSALVLSPALAILIFVGLGIGFALPFLAIGFVPAFRKLLPRPGAWLETFRKLMAVPMFLTALALAWLLGRQSGVNALSYGLAAALLAGFAFWWAGNRQRTGKAAIMPLALAGLVAVLALPTLPEGGANAATGSTTATNAMNFDADKLAELRAEGRPVFLYFTADWCLTCKVNESSSIARDSVQAAFARNNVAVMAGDWTLRDQAITEFLGQHGSAGVPLYLYYAPNAAQPEQLPQILTPQILEGLAG